MKKIFLLLAAVGMIFTACEPANGLDEDNNGNPTEQPDNGGNQGGNDNTGGEDNPDNPGDGDQGEEPIFITDNESDIVVEAKGGTVEVTVSTNLEYSVVIPEEAQSWLSVADTRAIRMEKLTFTIAKNEADAERSAVVKLLGSDNAELQSLSFVQKGASAEEEIPADKTQAIKFQDENTKLLCISHWDENEDSELSYEEAAAVTDLGTAFKGYSIIAFTELKYFTGLKSITDSAFRDCVSLVKITLPEQITTIGAYVFRGCTNLKKITIPNSVTEIGGDAFYNCSSLTRVDISDLSVWCKISFISAYANPLANRAKLYINGSELTDITIPSDITKIKAYAFNGYTSLKSITIPDSVTEIGCGAFQVCESLTSVTIPNSVTSIGELTFNSCSSLTSVTIGNSVTEIGFGAFQVCESLTSVTIPDSVTSIGEEAFRNCSSLTNATIPDSVTSIGYQAFYGCTGELIINSKIVETNYTDDNYPANSNNGWLYNAKFTKVTIGNSVTKIGKYAFYKCTLQTSITIPNGVTEIGYSAFEGCTSLTSITIPDSVTKIRDYAFYGCTGELIINSKIVETNYAYNGYPSNYGWLYNAKFTKVTIGNSVTKIGEYAFYKCTKLTSVTIGNSVTSIGYSAFEGCTSLTSITIPDSVTSIGEYAFEDCTSLTGTYVNITDLAAYAISNNTHRFPGGNKHLLVDGKEITKLVIPNSVTKIGYQAFYGCTSLTSITIPDSVTKIGEYAFYKCTKLGVVYYKGDLSAWCKISFGNDYANPLNEGARLYLNGSKLTDITIPSGITEIKNYTFCGCTSLTDVTIPNSVTKIGYSAFEDCTSLTSATIGNGVTSIGDEAFYNCDSLTSATIGDSVTSIGEWAFAWSASLTSVTIGDSVTSIGEDAFYGCDSLKEVYCKPTTPPAGGTNMFSYTSSSKVYPIGCKIYVPRNSVSAYKAKQYWRDYASDIVGYDF